ncbi:MAG: ATPase, partial [Gammaproteobacteria bacterium]|nr:ATPase [Gammaproteobacteria bacterium]
MVYRFMIPKKLFLRLALALPLLSGFSAMEVAAAPTAEQIRQFQSLSPEQRTALKASLVGGQKGAGASLDQSDRMETPVTVLPMKQQPASNLEEAAEASTDRVTLSEEKEEREVQGGLEQFGYDLFAGQATTFAPVANIPIPSEYMVGPGDTLQIFLFGKESAEHTLQINREGELNFPGIGPLQVVGMRFDELKQSLNDRIAQQMIGVRASITMGQLRSIRVFILGDVQRPGSYTVSGLSTMTNALFVSGGITKVGSLRNIQLKRRGKVVTTLDLYDLLLRGDTRQDARIQPGDVLFVPPVGEVVGVGGEVRRPALYEIRGERSVGDLIQMAGGFLSTAYLQASQIERINQYGERILLDVNLEQKDEWSQTLQDGDVLRVYSILEKMENIVQLEGEVLRPGASQWFEGMRLSDLIRGERDLIEGADDQYLIVKHEAREGRKIEVVSSNLRSVLMNPQSVENVKLYPRDQVTVLSTKADRMGHLNRLTRQLRSEARFGEAENVVNIVGNVRF